MNNPFELIEARLIFNEVINKDLNAEKNLFEIGGEYWRKAVIELSKAPELVENYLQSKQL